MFITEHWWIWPLLLFIGCFLIGVVAVPAGIGGGTLFVPLVSTFFPFHLDFVRGAGLVVALASALAAAPMLLRAGIADLSLALPLALLGSISAIGGAWLGLVMSVQAVHLALGLLVALAAPVHAQDAPQNDPKTLDQVIVTGTRVSDRTVAESLIKAILLVDTDPAVLPAEPDAWYDHQLVGLRVVRDGKDVGKVARVDHLPAQDLLAVETASGEILVPFIKQFVPTVDIAKGEVVVTPPGGLFEAIEDEQVGGEKGVPAEIDGLTVVVDETEPAESDASEA